MDNKEWDVFVSHASEDKVDFVLPLSKILQQLGLKVWLDVGELKVGDSLSRSIDDGLSKSRFGLVILSPAFLEKDWPEYEFRSLLARELGREKVILPIWHNVSRENILRYSPNLADRLAISTAENSIEDIGLEILDVINPDSSKAVQRRIAFLKHMSSMKTEMIPFDQIHRSKHRHERLPDHIVWRVRLIRATLIDVYPSSLESWVDGFLRDAHPTQEVEIWERFCAVFAEIIWDGDWSFEDKNILFGELFPMIMGLGKPNLKASRLTESQKAAVREAVNGVRSHAGEISDPEEKEHAPRGPEPDVETFEGPGSEVDREFIEKLAKR